MTDEKTHPYEREIYVDHGGRVLVVENIFPGDRLGREVQGYLEAKDGREETPYSCTLVTWARTWRDKKPPTPQSEWVDAKRKRAKGK